MTRRGLGRGRILLGVGAIVALVSMPLDWYRVGGQALPVTTGNGLEGAGVLIFVAAIAVLTVLTLPYASRHERSSLDRPVTYLLLAGLAVAGVGIRLVQIWGSGLAALTPDRAPGLWVGVVGIAVMCWGVAELLAEPAPLK
jgi:hypothetical protein